MCGGALREFRDGEECKQKIGWIGTGRMGTPMAERLLKAGHDVTIWNRTRAKAEPLTAKGGKVVGKLVRSRGLDVVFSIVSEGKDLEEVYFGKDGLLSAGGKAPKSSSTAPRFQSRNRRDPQPSDGSTAPTMSLRRSPATPR